ncbi:SIS domain-containing protein [Enorma phocaeensis]|uniref:SIS domain-containing protein n=1 Tax=Enorma phocaeensis TaxID=1871019 RepID=A0A921IU82_9ACTN|nr:SIS domain-containing protein [Enorma phocaeensis]HJG37701.1 SIS domain-containing protein [Enorma phocaeensis]
MNAHDLIKETIEKHGGIDTVYFVACGGSLIDLIPANALLQREAKNIVSCAYTAREFDIMRPARLGDKTLVIACSHSGNTPEVVDACNIALEAGASIIALTDNAGSKIDTGKWTTWVYPWGEGVPQAEVPAGISLSLAAELLDQQEGFADLADLYAGIAKMDEILPPAREKVNAELGERFAALCQDHKFLYILGSGPNYSQTYGFAICSLMEMQWQSCAYINSAEYFHGPFEVTEPGVFYFLQMGSSECRPMDERALAFLKTHTDTLMVLDAKEYGMEQVPVSVRAYLDPILFYAMNCELRAARGKVFDHDPDVRRYMGIEKY